MLISRGWQIMNRHHAIQICAIGALSESLVYTALAPLLNQLDGAEGFNHQQAGLLVAGYAIGYGLGSLPAYQLVAQLGPRLTAMLGSAALAGATLLFACGNSFPTLMAARILVGIASVVVYSGALTVAGYLAGPNGRGASIGMVYSGSAAGSALGPLIGSLASYSGRGPVFMAVAAGQVLIALLLLRLPAISALSSPSARTVVRHLHTGQVWIGLWITSLPGFALGVLTVSGTYRLHELGAAPLFVAVAFSGIATLNIFVASWLGRASDRLGRRNPVMLALAVATISVALIVALAFKISTVVLIAIAGACLLAVAGPGLSLIVDSISRDGGDPAGATLLMNLFWGPAAAIGSIAAGLVHGDFGVQVSLVMLATVAALSVLVVRRYA